MKFILFNFRDKDPSRLALVEHPKIVAVIKSALATVVNGILEVPDTETVKKSVQNHFRHHIIKFESKNNYLTDETDL